MCAVTLAGIAEDASLRKELIEKLKQDCGEDPGIVQFLLREGAKLPSNACFVLTLTTMDGARLVLPRDLLGRCGILWFWTCKLPDDALAMKRTVEKVRGSGQGLDVLAVNLDRDRQQVEQFIRQNQLNWTHVFSGQGFDDPLFKRYGNPARPCYWIILPHGKAIYCFSSRARGGAESSVILHHTTNSQSIAQWTLHVRSGEFLLAVPAILPLPGRKETAADPAAAEVEAISAKVRFPSPMEASEQEKTKAFQEALRLGEAALPRCPSAADLCQVRNCMLTAARWLALTTGQESYRRQAAALAREILVADTALETRLLADYVATSGDFEKLDLPAPATAPQIEALAERYEKTPLAWAARCLAVMLAVETGDHGVVEKFLELLYQEDLGRAPVVTDFLRILGEKQQRALEATIAARTARAALAASPETSPENPPAPPLAVAPFDEAAARRHQEAWAKHLAQPRELTNSIGMKLVLIPPGEFMMGNSHTAEEERAAFKPYGAALKADEIDDEYPRHRVCITRPFYLGMYHVTVGQYRKFVEEEGYKTDAEKTLQPGAFGFDAEKGPILYYAADYTWQKTGFSQTDNHPVVNLDATDAGQFCRWLNHKEGKSYRLPTEAEWEYACRAGTTTRFFSGDDPEGLAKVANVADAALKAQCPNDKGAISANDGYAFTAPVGSFPANAFGLYDMHGNAWQWCQDYYDGNSYATAPLEDPHGVNFAVFRSLRGGSWLSRPQVATSAHRGMLGHVIRTADTGFRVVLTLN